MMELIILCGYGRLCIRVNSARKRREIGYQNLNIVVRVLRLPPLAIVLSTDNN